MDWLKARNILSTIAAIVEKKAESLGFTDVSSTIAETFGDKYMVNITFKYKGKPYRAYGELSAMTLLSLKGNELTTFVVHRARDLVRHMCKVSSKDKEIPQTEEEYEQKTKWS